MSTIDDFYMMSSIVSSVPGALMLIKSVKDIGLIIRDRRRALRWGQGDLADKIRVSRQWIVQVEKGKTRAEAGLLLRALRALDLEITIDQTKPRRTKSAFPPHARGTPRGGANRRDIGKYDIDIDAVIERARGKKQ